MPRKIKGFSRVDSGDAHGWLVRIKRGEERRSRFISDSTHGGKRKSQLVAQKVYADWVKELPEPDTAEDKLGKRNESGVVGVHYSHDVDARYPNCSYEYYIASWKTEDGRRQNVRFAINRWGKKVAFELACLARSQRTSERAKIEKLYEKKTGKKLTPKKVVRRTPTSATAKPAKKKAPAKKAATKKPTKKVAKKAVKKKAPAKKAAKKSTKKKSSRRK